MSLWWLVACWVAFSVPAALLAAQVFGMCSDTERDIRERLEREWQREVRREITQADRARAASRAVGETKVRITPGQRDAIIRGRKR